VRGSFLVEGAMTGGVAAAAAMTLLLALYGALRYWSAAATAALLPGVGWRTAVLCGLALLGGGLLLGADATLPALGISRD
jgi:multisubunit Na+/H+ antiporter MnhB subunit